MTEPPGPAVPEDLIVGFREVPPATIGHTRTTGFVDPAIRPLYRLRRVVVGPAATLKLTPGDVTHTRAALTRLGAGQVLVVDAGGVGPAACWGEMTSLAAKVRGAAGVIVDGLVTDVVEIEAMDVPTWSRGVAALVGRRLSREGGAGVPVQCGGVVVNPGDLVVADDNGIVVIAPEDAQAAYAEARAYEDRSPHQRAWILGGGLLADLVGLDAAGIAAKVAERDQG
jgi:4-hydroxy-4-methyl-2-oxoglutarate aldolase